MTSDQTENIYFAGLFDGEGCIYIKSPSPSEGSHKYQLIVTLANTHRGIIEHLHDSYGGTVQTHGNENNRQRICACYTLKLPSRRAARFLQDISPWLRIKRQEADLALEFQNHMSARLPLNSETIKYRQSCMKQMKALKIANRDAL